MYLVCACVCGGGGGGGRRVGGGVEWVAAGSTIHSCEF